MENGYNISIIESSKELTKVERVKFKDTSDALKLDEISKQGEVEFDVDFYLLLQVHNDSAKGGNNDYRQLVIVDTDGTKYCTGSENFIRNFKSIAEELDGEEYRIKVIRRPSKNFSGKEFLTCAIA